MTMRPAPEGQIRAALDEMPYKHKRGFLVDMFESGAMDLHTYERIDSEVIHQEINDAFGRLMAFVLRK